MFLESRASGLLNSSDVVVRPTCRANVIVTQPAVAIVRQAWPANTLAHLPAAGPINLFLCPDGRVVTGEGRLAQ